MTIWMLYAMLVGALLYLAGVALERGMRAVRRPARFVWLALLAAGIIGPLAFPFTSRGVPTDPRAEFVQTTGAMAGTPAALAAIPSLTASARQVAALLDRPLATLWAALSIVLVGRIVLGVLSLRRRRAEWVVEEVAGARCYVTPDMGPAVVALPEPRIVIPQWMLSLEPASLATIVRHERQHLAAGDAWLIVAGSFASALVSWNPAVWLMRRRLRLALEMDCDARVLNEEPRVDRYGSLLLAIAQRPRLAAGLGATLTESTSDLERRIDAMTARPPRNPRVRAVVFATLAAAAIGMACGMPAPDMVAPNAAGPAAPPGAFFDFQVEKAVSANAENTPPRYPDQLRAANIEGQVVAKFVVDTNGLVDPRSFEIVKSDHDAFTAAVRDHMPNLRFHPARVGTHKVRQLVQMPFSFSLVKRTDLAESRKPKVEAGIRAPGNPRVLYELPADQSTPTVLRSNVPPVYPNQLRAANRQGMVQATFVVRADGSVDMSTFRVTRSDHEAFTTSVRAALTSWRFNPAMKNGKPVDAQMQMPFIFSLSR